MPQTFNELRRDIRTESDIFELVIRFYKKVRQDERMAPLFQSMAGEAWNKQVNKICDFWSALLLRNRKYSIDPVTRYFVLNTGREYFRRWLQLFTETVDEHFAGKNAREAKRLAGHVARLMQLMGIESLCYI